MINRKDIITSINTVINDLTRDTDQLNLENSTFQLSVKISSYGNDTVFSQNDTYFSLRITQHIEDQNGESTQDIGYSV